MTSTTGYFNTASHGVPVAGVYDSMTRVLESEVSLGPDGAAEHWAQAMNNTRISAAKLINGCVNQIGFSNTTTTAHHAMLMRMNLSGKRVLVSEHEWYEYYDALKSRGDVTVQVLPPIDFDDPDLSAWAKMIDKDVAAIMVPMVTSLTGLRYPVEAIGALPRPDSCKFIVDGAQSIGQMPVDVQAINCDAFLATGRKWLRGPRQTAFIWMNDSWDFTAHDTEAADQNIALRVGLGVAIDHVLEVDVGNIQCQILIRSDQIRDWARGQGLPLASGRTGTVSLSVTIDQIENLSKSMAGHGVIAKFPSAKRFEPLSGAAQNNSHFLRIAPHQYTSDQDMEMLFSSLSLGFGKQA